MRVKSWLTIQWFHFRLWRLQSRIRAASQFWTEPPRRVIAIEPPLLWWMARAWRWHCGYQSHPNGLRWLVMSMGWFRFMLILTEAKAVERE
jgi:hypothetical protein